MTPEQKKVVRDFIRTKALEILSRRKKRSLQELRQAMPFHLLFFGDEGIVAAANQRSIVTSMGLTLYPGLAKVIAELRYSDVVLGRSRSANCVSGKIYKSQSAVIDEIMNDLYAKRRSPNHEAEMKEILGAAHGQTHTAEVLPDLYVGDFKSGPLFVELKSPMANLDVSAESKRKVLTFLAIMHANGKPSSEGFLGLTYNPEVRKENFSHWPVLQMMDMEKQVLVGAELWDKLGGRGTFETIVEIIQAARKDIVRNLE